MFCCCCCFGFFEGVTYFTRVTFARRVLTMTSHYCNASITETLVNMAPDTSDVGGRPYTAANKMSLSEFSVALRPQRP